MPHIEINKPCINRYIPFCSATLTHHNDVFVVSRTYFFLCLNMMSTDLIETQRRIYITTNLFVQQKFKETLSKRIRILSTNTQ